MQNLGHMKTTTLPLKHSMNRTPYLLGLLLIPFALACFALSPVARAVCQEGCLMNNNTVLGDGALFSVTTGFDNTALGFEALFSVTTGSANTAVGRHALFSNTAGYFNTAIGDSALNSNTTGTSNTALGYTALTLNTTGIQNTATGWGALQVNSTGNFNTAIGQQALQDNTTASNNTATGWSALGFNTIGESNTAIGSSALFRNTTGSANTANGSAALFRNTTGSNNTAVGHDALALNDTGSNNTANGSGALDGNPFGRQNTASGAFALSSDNEWRGNSNTADGFGALNSFRDGNNNIALGSRAGENLRQGSDNIYIGNVGVALESNTIRMGTIGTQTNTYIAGISGATVPTGVAVIVDADGHLGTTTSSGRFKEAIKPMDKASEVILGLKPVTFRYKHELDAKGVPQFGLVAEDVEKVNPDLVARDAEEKIFTVRYEAVNAMLLNEFLKEHRTVQEQGATITHLKSMVEKQEAANAQQQKQIEALTTGLQKVSAQLELSKSAPQTVLNNQ